MSLTFKEDLKSISYRDSDRPVALSPGLRPIPGICILGPQIPEYKKKMQGSHFVIELKLEPK